MPRPRKGARLYLRQRGNSRVWVILDGVRQIATGASASELGKAEAELARHIGGRPKHTGPRDPAAVTIAEVIAVYSEQRGQHVRSSATLASGVERLLTFFTTEKCARLTPSRCDEYVEWRCAQDDRRGVRSRGKVKPPTARRELAVLSAAMTWAWRNQVITEHIPIRLPPKSEPRQRHLTRSEAARLLAGALGWDYKTGERNPLRINRHLARFILIALYTGTRHKAILELQWLPNTVGGWVDLGSGVLHRRAQGASESGKRRPAIPIPPRLITHLRRWRRLTALYVIEHNGLPIRFQIQSSWDGARHLAGLDEAVTPHILRHTCATWMLHAGVPMWQVAGVLGATEDIVRSTYGHHATEYLRDAVAVFSRGKEWQRNPSKRRGKTADR